ncbi:phage terminase large subunit [Aeromonas veronii]|uniref:phage terminase large subunit n=1 Tax=Aeromonas veronii TaxID=654 RepID=UPI003BA0501F
MTGNVLKDDFRAFLFLIWKQLNLPEPTPVQYDIAHFLQHGPKRTIIEAFRGVGKSFVTAALCLWLLYRNPDIKIMVVSATKERADAFSQFVKRLIAEIDFLKELRPRKGQRDTLIAFDVGPAKTDQSPSMKSVGITGQLTGSRADVIVADDIEVMGNSATQTARDKLLELVKEFDAVLKPLDSSRIIYLGTPQTEMSIYNMLPDRGYVPRIWPAEIPGSCDKYKGYLAPMIVAMAEDVPAGTPTDPRRFEIEDLLERKLSYGKAGYALQFMLDTSLSDADKYPLKLSDLIVHSVNKDRAPAWYTHCNDKDSRLDIPAIGLSGDYYYAPMVYAKDALPYQGKVLVVDPSGRGKDETAYCVGYMLNSNIFIPEAGGIQGGYSEPVLKALAEIAKKHEVNEIVVESNFGDGMFVKLLEPYVYKARPCQITEVRSQGQKERRMIDTLEPVLQQHRIIIDPKVIERDYEACASDLNYSLMHQMTRVTYERGALKHDDRLDALAMMVAYWVEHMNTDAQKTENERLAKAMEHEISSWFNQMGFSDEPDETSWINW